MCKKLISLGVVGLIGMFLLSTTGLGSYTSTWFHKMKGTVKKQVPLEFEIERVRNEVTKLVPDMKKNLSAIAEEMVAVENLKDEIQTTKANLKQREKELKAMSRAVEAGTVKVVYEGREFSTARINEKLSRDFGSYKRCEAEVKSKEQLLEAKERSLEAAREQLASMRSQKQELEVQIAQLEAEVKTVRLAQTKNKFQLDDTRLAQCKSTLAEIRTRLNVEKKMNELDGEFANDFIPAEKKTVSGKDLAKEVNSYLDGETDSKVAAQ